MKVPKVLVKLKSRPKHYLRWGFINIALLFFFADLIAAVWPAFDAVWKGTAHIGVAAAAVLATVSEYFGEDINHSSLEEKEKKDEV